ncbi:hypothetical protein PHMEG_00033198 [Phytophthora megakarya]|uniref:Uncharacterized protein n=1 Tax=Phytophthora megakarya TaxID=4795 RepID=A0A225UVC4_9STRA|nr:hypothetical protein PHMEG_00033198 [Phytophthora megakarya]
MAPTTNSDGQLENTVTRHTSSQVMSPMRVQQSTDVASDVPNTSQDISRNQDEGLFVLTENATGQRDILSRADAESLIRSLAGISGGRSLLQSILEQISPTNAGESEPIRNPQSSQRGSREPRRHPSDDMSGRYSNTELIDYTKVLINSQPIKLPKLHIKGDYKACHYAYAGDIIYGGERYDEVEGLRRVKYKEWFEARKNKPFSALALSLSVDLRTTFKIDDIRDSMNAAALLYSRITQHFEAADGINPDYLLQELVTRKLQPNESVTAYVEDIAANLLLSNCVEIFHDFAREHGDWINNHDRKTLILAEALQRLRAAEHQRTQLRVQTRQTALQPIQVTNVNLDQGQGQRGHRKRSQRQRKRGKKAAKKKQRSTCGGVGSAKFAKMLDPTYHCAQDTD